MYKQFVLVEYPNAVCSWNMWTRTFKVRQGSLLLGEGLSEDAAWADAYANLT